MGDLRVPSGWTGEAKALVRQISEESEAQESRVLSKIGSWKAWTPTLAWTTATPASVSTEARYCVIGKTAFFNIYIVSADGNDATNLTITLPIATKMSCTVAAFQVANGVYSNPICYIHSTDNKIKFLSFSACTNGTLCAFRITGQYEI